MHEQLQILKDKYENISSKSSNGLKYTYEEWDDFNKALTNYLDDLYKTRIYVLDFFEKTKNDTNLDAIAALHDHRVNVYYPSEKKINKLEVRLLMNKIDDDGSFYGYFLNDNTFWSVGNIREYKDGKINSMAYEFAKIIKDNNLDKGKKELEYYIEKINSDIDSVNRKLECAINEMNEIMKLICENINYIIDYEKRNGLGIHCK